MAEAATKSTALSVLKRLRQAGHEALFAGGCVRDMLLGKRSWDYDVATSASPYEVKKLFRHVLLIGAKFGVAVVIENKRKVEVTTFRSDLSYSDGRRPDGVRFSSPREDAERRDFTINGMFYDPLADKVIDYVGGQEDLNKGIVRTIGSADRRFSEDYLRMIRAVRFAIRFNFELEDETAQAVRRHAKKIETISGERICDELSKMLALDSAGQALEMLDDLGLAQVILRDLFSKPGTWQRAKGRVNAVAKRKDLMLTLGALLLELSGKSITKAVRRWGASNAWKEGLSWMASHRDDWQHACDLPLCEFKRLLAGSEFERLQVLWRWQERNQTGHQTQSRRIAKRIASVDPSQIAPEPLVTGGDLMKLGLREGVRLGSLLKELYDAQLNEQLTTRKQALNQAEQAIQQTA